MVVARAVTVPASPTSTFCGPVSCSANRAKSFLRGRWSRGSPSWSMCAVSGPAGFDRHWSPAGYVRHVASTIELTPGQELLLSDAGEAPLTRLRLGLGWDKERTAGAIGTGAPDVDLDASAVQFSGG